MSKLVEDIKSFHYYGCTNDRFYNGGYYLSDTKAAMILADERNELGTYARLHSYDPQKFDEVVFRCFNFDENGIRKFDIGSTTIDVTISERKLALTLFDESAQKEVRTLPAKNSDPDKFNIASEDLKNMRKQLKTIYTRCKNFLFDAFLEGTEYEADLWKSAYLGKHILTPFSRVLVWKQGSTYFTVGESHAVTSDGNEYEISDSEPISVAYPMDMAQDEIQRWQNYFLSGGLKQPFEQVWEPVCNFASIAADRYDGAVISCYSLGNKESAGITTEWLGADKYTTHPDHYGFELTDCTLDQAIVTDDELRLLLKLGKFSVQKQSRTANHAIYVLDKLTVSARVGKDDITALERIDNFTQAQISELFRVANEKNAVNCKAALMELLHKDNEEADPFAEFTLDL